MDRFFVVEGTTGLTSNLDLRSNTLHRDVSGSRLLSIPASRLRLQK